MTGGQLAREGGTFLVVGLAATAAHVTAALAARELAHLAPLTANLCGYGCAVGVSYLGNARLTFRRRAADPAQFARFLATSLAVLALNQGLVWLLVEQAGWPFRWALGPVVVASPVLSFALAKLWAFRPRAGAADAG